MLYDRLVSPALLDEAPAHAERVFVGKQPGEVHSRQIVADALLVSRAREGKSVVRLKGGDPFVFGRGGEEALLSREASVPFEVVPGVSSAIAAPAYAGIPVTHRGAGASFVVLTGREEGDVEVDPAGLSVGADTIVLLMGVSALEQTARRLIDAGRAATEPAATIEWGTTGRQRVVVADLGTIAERVRAEGLEPPATTVIGRVVELRDALGWFEARPLFGTSVAITRPADQSRTIIARLTDLGADVVRLPLIEISDPTSFAGLDAAIDVLAAGGYDWALFASANAVHRFFERLSPLETDARAFAATRIGVVGAETARALSAHSLRADLVPENATAAELARSVGKGPGRILFPRVEAGPRSVIDSLVAAGWEVDDVAAYANVPAVPDPVATERVLAGEVDVITFTSPSTVENFAALVGPPDRLDPAPRVVCIGPSTAEAARGAGFDVTAVAEPHDTDGLIAAVLQVAGVAR